MNTYRNSSPLTRCMMARRMPSWGVPWVPNIHGGHGPPYKKSRYTIPKLVFDLQWVLYLQCFDLLSVLQIFGI